MGKNKTAVIIITSAIIWGMVILGCALALKGTECFNSIQNILITGVSLHLILIWVPMGFQLRKDNQKK